jgi:hypothetical protein
MVVFGDPLPVHISPEAGAFASLAAYPNPTRGQISFHATQVILPNSGPITLQVMNMTGQVVQSTSVSLPQGGYTFSMDLSALPSGVYLARLLAPDGFPISGSSQQIVLE